MLVEIILILLNVIVGVYWYITKNFGYFAKHGIPELPGSFPLGSEVMSGVLSGKKNALTLLDQASREQFTNDKMFGCYLFGQRQLVGNAHFKLCSDWSMQSNTDFWLVDSYWCGPVQADGSEGCWSLHWQTRGWCGLHWVQTRGGQGVCSDAEQHDWTRLEEDESNVQSSVHQWQTKTDDSLHYQGTLLWQLLLCFVIWF